MKRLPMRVRQLRALSGEVVVMALERRRGKLLVFVGP
jgi:hypothetical protein